MINYLEKDITTVEKGVIIHGVNTKGVMGSGVALFLKQKYPQIFPRYHQICKATGGVQASEEALLGGVDFVNVDIDLFVANCFTQHLYGYDGKPYARPTAIRDSLAVVYGFALLLELPVYLPKIGAGRGGLSWDNDVEPIVHHFATLDRKVNTYVCTWAE